MIYIENKDGVQRVVIPTNDTNVEYVNFVPQEGDSDYYTKTQTDEKIAQSRTAVLGEVGDWLSLYATTDYVHEAVENVTVDLTGYATEEYVDAEIQKIPKPDMSDYYTKEETDDKIDDALLTVPSMLENAGFATQNWVEQQDYATKQYVDDAVADIPADGGIEPVIVEVDSFEPITKTDFNQLFESYSQGIPSYIQSNVQNNITTTPQLMPVVGIYGKPNNVGVAKMWVIYEDNLIEYTRNLLGTNVTHTTIPLGGSGDSTDLSDYYTKGEVDTVKDDLQAQITDNHNSIIGLDSRVKDIELNGGGSGGDSGVKVYEALWDDATAGYTRFTNQMVYDMCKDYSDSLTVQVRIGGELFNVYYVVDSDPRYYVYILAANIMGELVGDINLPSGKAGYNEKILVTREVFDKAIPHKYDYTITDDITFEGFFSEGEGYELFNDVRDGVDFNFKLITNETQSRLIPFQYDYDSQMYRANFWFLDMGGYIIYCTMEYDGSMTISKREL